MWHLTFRTISDVINHLIIALAIRMIQGTEAEQAIDFFNFMTRIVLTTLIRKELMTHDLSFSLKAFVSTAITPIAVSSSIQKD